MLEIEEQPAADQPADHRPQASLRGLVFVGLAVFFFSTSPVFVRWAVPFSPVVIAAGRLVVAALALGLALGASRRAVAPIGRPVRARRTVVLRFAAYGLIAALHFLCYIAALSYTTPA